MRRALCIAVMVLAAAGSLWAGVGASISGTVLDAQGAAVGNATVTLLNPSTNVRQTIVSDDRGIYSFRGLGVGTYELQVLASGFKPYRRTAITVDANDALIVDVALVVGQQSETVTVKQTPVTVDTASTQLGEVITGTTVDAVPLNGRSFTDLLALQPGVAPQTTITGSSVQAAGASTINPSGYLNPGTISINGQREYANGFSVNDADVVERFTMGAAVIPNLDSISEFRVLTGNFNAEYGNYSGGRINVVTKSGANQFHGSAFEFLRNTDFDAKNFFSSSRGAFQQNQYGGTFGGPVVKNKIFFYVDYQGTSLKQGVDTGDIAVPTAADRSGNLSDLASSFVATDAQGNTVPTTVSGPYFANLLTQRLGYTVTQGEPYYVPGCTSPAQCVLPNATIPTSAWSVPAQKLLQYIPEPNVADNTFETSSEDLLLHDKKGSIRLDGNSRFGMLSSYYFIDDYALNNPYPTQQGGANVPGFNAMNIGRSQLLTLGDTKTIDSRSVNEVHFSFVRDVNILGAPVGGVGPSLADQGFVNPSGGQSIVANRPAYEGIENTIFNSYTIGIDITGLNQYDNTWEFRDNYSRVIGAHTVKLGGEFLYSQVNAYPDVQSNGTFTFAGTETGSDFADFLLGIPSRFTQGDAQAFYMRNKYGALFAEDSWRVTRRITLNYGLRWDVIQPWYEKYNQIQTIIPGEQSVVFPGAPEGLVFPTDPGVARSLAPTRWDNFSPRLGIAYAPGPHDGLLGKILGGADKTSIRAGFGRFFSAVEGFTSGVMAGDAPYGQTYTSPGSPLLSDPYITAANGFDNGQRFPLHYPPLNATASNPNNTVNWADFLPINGLPGYQPSNVSPYTEQYTLSIQRQFGSSSLLTLAYVGSQAHHLIVLEEANPGNPALCLSLSQTSQVAPGSATCGPFQESASFVSAAGQVINGTRTTLGPNFGSVDWLSTIGNSNYNGLEISLRHTTRRAEFLAGYTWSKSLDNSSSLSDQLVPGYPHLSYGYSAFDLRNNFVASYRYQIPFEQLFRANNRLTQGWTISGITRFSTGFPVTFQNPTDNSLLGTEPDGVNSFTADLPYETAGRLAIGANNPRSTEPCAGDPTQQCRYYFNTALIGVQPLGTPGNVPRRFFSGPGLNNFDLALLKDTRITESTNLQFRLEAFNAFNHAQFFGPNAVDGNLLDSTYGQVISAAPPRLVQVALKFSF
ncbi:MAG: carboxypeptidase regulatory-like domain-containing protein [Candidatus Acidiferrum sp.]